MSNWRQWLMAIACGMAAIVARAEIVPELYTVNVPVADQTAAELQRAAGTGLRELAVRITGRSEAERSSALASAFADAQRLLTQYRYERSGEGWSAQLKYASFSVDQLLRNANLPVWGADRPALKAWLIIINDGQGARFIDDAAPIAAALRAQAQRRGVMLHLPTDFASVTADDVARLDVTKVQAATQGRAPVLLLGRIEQNGNSFSGPWLLAANGQQVNAEQRAESLQEYLAANFDRLIDALSAQYATTAAGSEGVILSVSGISRYEDYAALLSYLQRISLIKRAQPTIIRDDEVQLQLNLRGTAEQLTRQFALENKLTPIDAATNALSYRWSVSR
jgi:uncharacterized protein